jgi:hypothetical protein
VEQGAGEIQRAAVNLEGRGACVTQSSTGANNACAASWRENAVSEKAGRTRGKPDGNQNPAGRR